jgi:hypothetical protein
MPTELQRELTPEQELAKQQAMVGTLMLSTIVLAAFCVGFFFGWRKGLSDGRGLAPACNRLGEPRE